MKCIYSYNAKDTNPIFIILKILALALPPLFLAAVIYYVAAHGLLLYFIISAAISLLLIRVAGPGIAKDLLKFALDPFVWFVIILLGIFVYYLLAVALFAIVILLAGITVFTTVYIAYLELAKVFIQQFRSMDLKSVIILELPYLEITGRTPVKINLAGLLTITEQTGRYVICVTKKGIGIKNSGKTTWIRRERMKGSQFIMLSQYLRLLEEEAKARFREESSSYPADWPETSRQELM